MSIINFSNDEINDFEASHANLLESIHTVLYYHKRFTPVLEDIKAEYEDFYDRNGAVGQFVTAEGKWDKDAEERAYNQFAYHLGCDYRGRIYDLLNEKYESVLGEDKVVAEGVYQFILQFDKMFDSWETLGHIALGNECIRVASRYVDYLTDTALEMYEAELA